MSLRQGTGDVRRAFLGDRELSRRLPRPTLVVAGQNGSGGACPQSHLVEHGHDEMPGVPLRARLGGTPFRSSASKGPHSGGEKHGKEDDNPGCRQRRHGPTEHAIPEVLTARREDQGAYILRSGFFGIALNVDAVRPRF